MSARGGGAPTRVVSTVGPVLIIGSGLLGASLGLALRAGGVRVYLEDASPTSLSLASDVGAGVAFSDVIDEAGVAYADAGTDAPGYEAPCIVVVATPPDVADRVIVDSLLRFPGAIVTDVASVKDAVVADVLATLEERGLEDAACRYVGSHPMAGRERSGAGAADADLFYGRPWVIVAHETTWPRALLAARALATDVGAVPLEMNAGTHDHAVALVSHVPQLVSSMLAARLVDAPAQALGPGQGCVIRRALRRRILACGQRSWRGMRGRWPRFCVSYALTWTICCATWMRRPSWGRCAAAALARSIAS